MTRNTVPKMAGATVALAALMALTTPGGALAQGTAATANELAALRARIDRLEAEAEQPKLGFGVGPGTTITAYGFVRAEAFYDFDFDQGDLTQTGNLNTVAPTDGAFNTSVRVSRLGFRLASDTDIGKISGQLEYDLFGSGGSAQLRLRHANVGVGGFLLGQTWTNFMPIGQYPNSADFNGPVGITFARVPQIRYTGTAGNVTYSASIEEAAWASEDPVFTAAAQYSSDRFTGRLAVLAGKVQGGGFEDDAVGITASASTQLWQGGKLTGTYTTGEGIGGLFIGGGSALTLAGVANDVDGYTLEVRQAIGDKVDVGIAYGNEDYDNPGAADLSKLETIHVNAFWKPADNLTLAAEYITGRRTDGGGTKLQADRVGVSVTFNF